MERRSFTFHFLQRRALSVCKANLETVRKEVANLKVEHIAPPQPPETLADKVLARMSTRILPPEWPALMTSQNMSPQTFAQSVQESISNKDKDFYGAVSFQKGRGVKTVVSFPGQYKDDWSSLVRRSVKRTAFEMDRENQPFFKYKHYEAGSTSCVFLLPGSKYFGGHPYKPDSSECWCKDLYGSQQEFGCTWFVEWQKRVLDAVEKGHTLVVVYKAGQTGVGREGLSWPPRIDCSQTRRDDPGLGVSQRGEVAWLLQEGFCFEEEDVQGYRQRLMADIEQEQLELQAVNLEDLKMLPQHFYPMLQSLEVELVGIQDRFWTDAPPLRTPLPKSPHLVKVVVQAMSGTILFSQKMMLPMAVQDLLEKLNGTPAFHRLVTTNSTNHEILKDEIWQESEDELNLMLVHHGLNLLGSLDESLVEGLRPMGFVQPHPKGYHETFCLSILRGTRSQRLDTFFSNTFQVLLLPEGRILFKTCLEEKEYFYDTGYSAQKEYNLAEGLLEVDISKPQDLKIKWTGYGNCLIVDKSGAIQKKPWTKRPLKEAPFESFHQVFGITPDHVGELCKHFADPTKTNKVERWDGPTPITEEILISLGMDPEYLWFWE